MLFPPEHHGRAHMPLSDLTPDERRVVHACMVFVAAGDVIFHDVEFPTIMGISPAELQSV